MIGVTFQIENPAKEIEKSARRSRKPDGAPAEFSNSFAEVRVEPEVESLIGFIVNQPCDRRSKTCEGALGPGFEGNWRVAEQWMRIQRFAGFMPDHSMRFKPYICAARQNEKFRHNADINHRSDFGMVSVQPPQQGAIDGGNIIAYQ